MNGPIKPFVLETLNFRPARLMTRLRVDRLVRRRNQVPTRRLSSAFAPFNGFRFLLPGFKSSQLSIHPASTFKSSLRYWAPSVIRSLSNASYILSVREFTSCAIGLSLDSVPLRIRGEDPGRSLELHRRFLESIGDQFDTVPGIHSSKSLRSFDPTGERIRSHPSNPCPRAV